MTDRPRDRALEWQYHTSVLHAAALRCADTPDGRRLRAIYDTARELAEIEWKRALDATE